MGVEDNYINIKSCDKTDWSQFLLNRLVDILALNTRNYKYHSISRKTKVLANGAVLASQKSKSTHFFHEWFPDDARLRN